MEKTNVQPKRARIRRLRRLSSNQWDNSWVTFLSQCLVPLRYNCISVALAIELFFGLIKYLSLYSINISFFLLLPAWISSFSKFTYVCEYVHAVGLMERVENNFSLSAMQVTETELRPSDLVSSTLPAGPWTWIYSWDRKKERRLSNFLR